MTSRSRRFGIISTTCAALMGLAGLSGAAVAGEPTPDERWAAAYDAGVRALRAKAYADAEKHLLEAFERTSTMEAKDSRHRRTLETLVELWMTEREWATAQPWIEKLVALDERVYGRESVDRAYNLARLAQNALMMGRHEDAEHWYVEALRLRTAAAAPGTAADPGREAAVATLQHNLAETYRRMKRLDKAEALYKEALRQKEAALGPEHPKLATSLADLGLLYNELKDFERALPLLKRAVALASADGKAGMVVGRSRHALGDALAGLERHDQAEAEYRAAIASAEAQSPIDRPGLGSSLNNLGNLLATRGRNEEALAAYRRAVEVRTTEYGGDHARVRSTLGNLAALLARMGRTAEAEAIRARIGR